jgi:Na+-transporting methylmalonyl-CoA/oxaloacetate decarboxylase gamma subunit
MNIDVQGFLDTLPIMGKGMAGIFIVTIILITSIYVLNFIGNRIGKKDNDDK